MIQGVIVHGANIQDRDGAKRVIQKARFNCPEVEKVWADGGYGGKLERWVDEYAGWQLDIVRRCDRTRGFEVLPKRWIVERTFGWLNRYRRLSKDYEFFAQSSENIIYLAMINLMLHRLAPEPKNHNYRPRKAKLAV